MMQAFTSPKTNKHLSSEEQQQMQLNMLSVKVGMKQIAYSLPDTHIHMLYGIHTMSDKVLIE